MNDNDRVIILVCEECDEEVYVDKTGPEDAEEWGEYSAECNHCDAKYKDLKANPDRTWTDEDGRTLQPYD